jgi:phosphoglycerate dehydrogenase-like enzyme
MSEVRMARIWVPTQELASGLAGLPGAAVEVVAPDGSGLPPGAADVEFYVPPFFPPATAVAAIAELPQLRVVQALTAGVDKLRPHIPSGVLLCNARGAHDASTAEWVVAAILASLRSFPFFSAEQAAGRWSYQATDCLAGKTVLIIGYGSIGAAVERRLAPFEVQVLRAARSARDGISAASDIPSLLPLADVVVFLVPVTPDTVGMADAAFLARMKDGALLVNAARGSVVVTDALCAQLRSGRLHAAVDVTDPEPLGAGHPLWAMRGVFITPHVAASTPVSASGAIALVRTQVRRFLNGEPLANVVTGEY